jgi:TRAP-type C4-dicarboxylate transport system permease small subunit
MNDPVIAQDALGRHSARLAYAATVLAAAGLLGMVAAQGWQVLARYALNASPSWTEPLTLVFLSTTLAFGAAAGVHARSHFSFPLLVLMLPLAWQRRMAQLSALVTAGIGLLMAWYGAQLAWDGLFIPMAGAPLPQSAAFIPLALGGALMALFALAQLRSSEEKA